MRNRIYPNPVRDWLMLLSLFIFALCIVVALNVWMFQSLLHPGARPQAKNTQKVFDPASLVDLRPVLSERAAEALKYQSGEYHFVDPSL